MRLTWLENPASGGRLTWEKSAPGTALTDMSQQFFPDRDGLQTERLSSKVKPGLIGFIAGMTRKNRTWNRTSIHKIGDLTVDRMGL